MIDISKYSAYFHDGGLIDVQYNNCDITLSLESAEMDLSDIHDNIPLSEFKTIKGKLHLNDVKLVKVNGDIFFDRLKMKCDSGKIFDLQFRGNVVMIALSWVNFRPKPPVNDFSTIEIEAEKIWWENIPDLYDPFE